MGYYADDFLIFLATYIRLLCVMLMCTFVPRFLKIFMGVYIPKII